MRRLIALFATAMSACAVAGCGWIAEVVSTRVDAADYFTAPPFDYSTPPGGTTGRRSNPFSHRALTSTNTAVIRTPTRAAWT